jgi:predicted GNAT superfamily acetyltransferase
VSTISYRRAEGADLVAGARLLAEALQFSAEDAIPAWLIQTASGDAGGVALGAFAGGELIGFSFALHSADGSLFSCGLAVRPEHRSRGVGRGLKVAQRQAALAQGVEVIRWTADPLNGAGLRLYLSRLGARLVAYRPELYELVRRGSGPPQDDVTIEWRLTSQTGNGAPGRRVEIPFDARRLDPEELARWRLRVRHEMSEAVGCGGVGVGVDVHVAERRAWVLFADPARA